MSAVAVVQAIGATWREEGWEAATRRHFAPDVVWDMRRSLIPEADVHTGHEAVIGFFRAWSEPFEAWEVQLVEAWPEGERAVAVWHQAGRASGADVEMTFFVVYEVDGALVSRATVFQDRDEAIAVARAETKPQDDGTTLDA